MNSKKIKIIFITSIFVLIYGILFLNNSKVEAAVNKNEIENIIHNMPENVAEDLQENITENIPENITKDDILKIYDQVTEKYTNDEIANMILENKDQIEKQGISEDMVEAGAEFIRNTDQDEVRNIIKNDIDLDDLKQKLESGYTPEQALKSVVQETSATQKISIALKLLLANKTVKLVITIIVILFVYCTITRAIIYKKAGKHPIAAFIPLYRQITMYKICRLISIPYAILATSNSRLDSNVYNSYNEKNFTIRSLRKRYCIPELAC